MRFLIYPALCVYLPCAIYQIMVLKQAQRENRPYLLRHLLWVYIFLTYLILVFSVTGIGSIWDIGKFDGIIRMEEINLIPFQSEGTVTYILNIIMTMPLGFLLPLIWKRYRSLIKVVLTGACFSLAIEFCQLFNRRTTDIDDLIMNTIGAALGYALFTLCRQIFHKTKDKVASLSFYEPSMYLVLAVFGEFVLYNWRLLI